MVLMKGAFWVALPLVGYGIGWYIDCKETERMTLFRDKSALYARKIRPSEPSWP